MYKVLVIEDEEGIREGIKNVLKPWNIEILVINDFSKVTEEFVKAEPHLVLMDIGLPFYNGFYWCSEIRKLSKVPIVFISSASDNMNIVMAMNMGGDDFIAKPFDGNVLVAKVQAILRRVYDFADSVPILEHKGAFLNTGDNTFMYNDKQIALSKNEFRILLILMQNKGKTVSREKLMEALWKTDTFVDENTLTVNVGRLRKKLEENGLPGFIETKVGMGYIIS